MHDRLPVAISVLWLLVSPLVAISFLWLFMPPAVAKSFLWLLMPPSVALSFLWLLLTPYFRCQYPQPKLFQRESNIIFLKYLAPGVQVFRYKLTHRFLTPQDSVGVDDEFHKDDVLQAHIFIRTKELHVY